MQCVYAVAAVVVAHGSYSRGASAVAVDVGVEVVLGAAHTEALAASDGSVAAESERSSGTVDFPCMPWRFHYHTAVAVADSTQLAAASAGGH